MMQTDVWSAVLKRIMPTINKANFITWFHNTNLIEVNDGKGVVAVPTVFARDYIMNKFKLKVLQALQEVDSSVKEVECEIVARLSDKSNNEGINVKTFYLSEEKKVRKVKNINEVRVKKGEFGGHISSRMLNSKYRLDSFVIGNDNRLPHAAASAVAGMPGGIYNPLYVYGGVGLGKTHLLQAIGNEIIKTYPDLIVKYITAERFVSEVVDAIGRRDMKKFKSEYRNVDCFLIDDIQFFARKDSSQQEFFHTFNELYDNNKQIVLTSDRAPSELDDLDERLASRFGMGMVVELISPDFETRLAILYQKCKEFEVMIDPEVLAFIANNINTSVRELEGVLRQVVADMQLTHSVATISSAAQIIRRLDKAREIIGYDLEAVKGPSSAQTVDDVINVVAGYYKITVNDLIGDNRQKEIMIPRQVCMYLIKNSLGASYERIGQSFGGRNHTTVMHACNKTLNRLTKDIKIIKDVNTLKREMGF
jgi:chromosomal replication initiator protein